MVQPISNRRALTLNNPLPDKRHVYEISRIVADNVINIRGNEIGCKLVSCRIHVICHVEIALEFFRLVCGSVLEKIDNVAEIESLCNFIEKL
jgi:hypothetical protein